MEDGDVAFVIDEPEITEMLGPERFSFGLMEEEDEVGVATGVVWTSTGGDILQIEVLPMLGKSELRLTGQLGQVMQESAQAAFSYVRSRADALGIRRRTSTNTLSISMCRKARCRRKVHRRVSR